jgi:hypothetical protein
MYVDLMEHDLQTHGDGVGHALRNGILNFALRFH